MNKECFATGTLVAVKIDGNMVMTPIDQLTTRDFVEIYCLNKVGELETVKGSAIPVREPSTDIVDVEFSNGWHFICTDAQKLEMQHTETFIPAFASEGQCIETWGLKGEGESGHLQVKNVTPYHEKPLMYDIALDITQGRSVLVGNEDGICISVYC